MKLIKHFNLHLFFLFSSIFFVPLLFDDGVYLKYELPKIILFRIIVEIWLLYYLIQNPNSFYNLKIFIKKHFWELIMFFVLLTIMYFHTGNQIAFIWGTYHKKLGLFTIVYLIVFIYLCGFAINNFNRNFRYWFNTLMNVVLMVMFIICLYQFLFTDILSRSEGRWIGTFGQPNFLGIFILSLLPFQLEIIKNVSYKSKAFFFNFTLLCCSLLLIFLSGSRIILLSTVVLVLGKLVKKLLINFNWRSWVLFIASVILTIVVILNSRIVEIGIEQEFRFLIWKAGFKVLLENWLWGIGFDNLTYYLPQSLIEVGVHSDILVDRTHNELLDWFIYLGIPGSLVILIILIKNIKKLNLASKFNQCKPALTSLLFLSAYSMVNNNGIWSYIWGAFLIGYIFTAPTINETKNYLYNKWYMVSLTIITLSFVLINLTEYVADNQFKKYSRTHDIKYLYQAYNLNRKEEIYWSYLMQNNIYEPNKYIESQSKVYSATYLLKKGKGVDR